MLQPFTQNPYALSIGSEISSGLNSIAAVLPASPNEDQLVDAVALYIKDTYYSSVDLQLKQQIKSVAYNVINSFRNNLVLSDLAYYNIVQISFIQLLIGTTMTTKYYTRYTS